MCAGVQRAARRDHVESSFLPGRNSMYICGCTQYVHVHVHVRCTQHVHVSISWGEFTSIITLNLRWVAEDLARVRHSWRRPAAAAAAASYANFSQAEAHVRVLLGSA